jgi:chemotaxis protein MotB
MEAGIEKSQIAQILGMGDTAPLDIENPESDINRRIAIVLLNQKAQEGVESRSGSNGSGVKFINEGEGAGGENQDARQPVINTSGSLIKKLKEDRERIDNSYDAPPNQEESFW